MANEITISAALSIARTGLTLSASSSSSIDQAGDANSGFVQTIGTSTEQITMLDVVTPGYYYLRNDDATNFILIGLATPVTAPDAFITLAPGKCAVFPSRQTVIYAKADTAPCNLQVVIAEL